MPDTLPAVRRRRGPKLLLLVPLAGLLLLFLYTSLLLWWNYSEGERVGILQKSSRKGWICKTYEGELALYVVGGVSPLIWAFSARDPAVFADLNAAVGRRVRLHYSEHPGLPTSCFGETPYFVERVEVLPEGVAVTPATP